MGTELFTLTPDTVVASALRLASARRIRHFLVIEDGSLTGIVCQSDLRQARESSLVSGCMKSPVLCIGPDTTVKDAVDIMDQNEVGCLPVVTGTFLVGMITRDRLSKLTGKPPARSLIASVEIEAPVEDEELETTDLHRLRQGRGGEDCTTGPGCSRSAATAPRCCPPPAPRAATDHSSNSTSSVRSSASASWRAPERSAVVLRSRSFSTWTKLQSSFTDSGGSLRMIS